MPVITKLIIENFKGIEKVTIDLEGKSTSPVHTLIGLNESGKTTILEALSHFITGDRSVSSLFDGTHTKANELSIIPMHRKAAYTGEITIRAEVILSNDDIGELQNMAKLNGYQIDVDALKAPIIAFRKFVYEDSALQDTKSDCLLELRVKKRKSKSFQRYTKQEETDDLEEICTDYILNKLPQISYFPTFLVEMPSRIYLKKYPDETPLNRHYRFVLQDILDSLGEDLSLEKHVNKRIEDFKKDQSTSNNWMSMLFGSASKSPIDSVFQKISSAVTKEVLGSWQRVFQRAISAKSISVEWNVDTEKSNLPYATFNVSDGESKYAINERSLGFRWFFSFLLFTGFKKKKLRKSIFIFDEPAANLHAKAQAELLTSFSKIASSGNRIIYSTHSHHMINPSWLGSAYIVENAALDYDGSDSFGLDTKPTNISAIPYRQFVSQYPNRSSYFQPVIEKLEYITPEIVGSAPYMIVEGVSDYYVLRLASKILNLDLSYRILPGTGSSSSAPIISQLLAHGQIFAILLDDDKAGRDAQQRYKENWFLGPNVIFTLSDIDDSFNGLALEKILGNETYDLIKSHFGLTTSPTKQQVGYYLSESCGTNEDVTNRLPTTTVDKLSKILFYFQKHFKQTL